MDDKSLFRLFFSGLKRVKKSANQLFEAKIHCRRYFFTWIQEITRYLTRIFLHHVENSIKRIIIFVYVDVVVDLRWKRDCSNIGVAEAHLRYSDHHLFYGKIHVTNSLTFSILQNRLDVNVNHNMSNFVPPYTSRFRYY